ncbi:VPLPA-CTERM sorting domain-containing protein [Roseovarius sp. ZX-A-9]|uniref:VPLPA-CTERM sorting domain-containing protein n=1 Tax=Roseovarius sp. ZX-A-9 TaxID=3014783 RepID=UPI00232D21B6|nr:VPLPA-CTERM sorting domain-containing protein [Roseovarius sp. ZX-A-9]
MTKMTLLAAAALALSIAVPAANAATVTVNGSDWEINTVRGTFGDIEGVLTSQVWWGDRAVAIDFAEVVGDTLGLPNFGIRGPSFSYVEAFDPKWVSSAFWNSPLSIVSELNTDKTAFRTWAVATPVAPIPIPASGLLLLTGLAGVAGLKRRKKRAA